MTLIVSDIKLKEGFLTDVHELAIFIFCMIGCGVSCWQLGKAHGIQETVVYLVDEGMLEVDEDE